MKRAYIDASAIVGLHFHEAAGAGLWKRIRTFDQLISSALTVAEVLAALKREKRSLSEADGLLDRVSMFTPDSSLREECEEALKHGSLRGADLWHVATALAIAGRKHRKALMFITLDDQQGEVCAELGFNVLP